LDTLAVLLNAPESLALSRLALADPGEADVVVDVEWSGISTGTERLLYTGRMPSFPGMGYPLVPGYESVGRIVAAGPRAGREVGARVFVPGARCFGEVRGLFGGAASRLVVPGAKARPIGDGLAEQGVLLALAATAYHAVAAPGAALPDLIIGHGVLGRLIARIALALGGAPPTVWETNPVRAGGAEGYAVIDPIADERRDYRAIHDVSGDATILDTLIARLAPGGELVLAGFYADRLSFAFPPAFMREARFRIAAEWKEPDIEAVTALIADGHLSLDGLITHHQPATAADEAYRTAFGDPACLKMILDWRSCS
jgi:3-hydroxyethyl bacteriochlorophyllide a dehydrogenase